MNRYRYLFETYSFFNQKVIFWIRFLLYLVFALLILQNLNNVIVLKTVVSFFFLFLVNEVFLHYKVFKMRPRSRVEDATDPQDALLFSALYHYVCAINGYDLISSFMLNPEAQFIAYKVDSSFTLFKSDISKTDVLNKALEIVKSIKGDYILEIDLLIAYIILTEDKAKLLEKNDLRTEDAINLLYWARNKYWTEKSGFENLVYDGSGVFDFFIFGWNVETKKYTSDMSMKVLSYRFAPSVVGRTKEYEKLISALSKDQENSVILIGEPGTGKMSLAQYFAYQSHIGHTPGRVAYRRVFELYIDRLLSGAQNQGELEERLVSFFEDVYHSGNTIVFIQNIENVFGQGGFGFDVSGAIFEYLKSGKIQIIGTSSSASYKRYLENRSDISVLFEIIRLEEPSEKDALFMLFEKVWEKESTHGVDFTYGAIKATVSLSSSYLIGRYLPGKAVDLLEEVASDARVKNKKIVDRDDVIKKIEEKTQIVLSAPTEKEKNILLNLEQEIHKRIIDQQQAVDAVSNAIRRLRSGFANRKRPISVFLFLGPTGVGKTETAKALAQVYFKDENRMIRLDMSEYQTQESIKRLLGSLPGEDYSPSEFMENIKEHPFSLLLLDEFEKANPQILNVFLQVFDDGRLTDNLGRTIPFTNTIIIATSNAGTEQIREMLQKGMDITSMKKTLLDYLQKNGLFRPELLNRFDDIIIFKPLGSAEIKSIAELELAKVLKQTEEKSIYIKYDGKIIDKISKEAFDAEFGARNVRRFIESNVENYVSKMILQNQIKKGDKKLLTVDEKGQIAVV
ncbi:MAG: hypothetical protein A2857_02540 [Candidatus Levybacteria bacterium RIFCSPHIGHO2_01_FULL_36_15]|nr:MAG: hypothetical protein A2857_02540 [Candidatus Levybacteria bacterium RIFCSPHIGHO2_01_FULL_36_15]OGH38637.1 MAG: hypothetical protein A2905_05430 [Candidatus Levybacteria bacterium RIFCSPLOWO2_01_FULL_36_10]